MNQDLRTMRYAMQQSYLSGRALNAKRNNATIILVEDRLDVDSRDKFGTRNRIPTVTHASATYSQNLFMPMDYGVANELPVMDLFINGVHLELRTAGFATYFWGPPGTGTAVDAPLCDNNNQVDGGNPGPYGICWAPGCNSGEGCARVKKRSSNFPNNEDWCSPHQGSCGQPEMDNRFDLDFSGAIDGNEPTGGATDTLNSDCAPTAIPLEQVKTPQDCFSWQWIDLLMIPGTMDIDEGINLSLDADGDTKMETVLEIVDNGYYITDPSTGHRTPVPATRVHGVKVIDSELGDMALTWNDWDDWRAREIAEANGETPPAPLVPGLGIDSVMYSFTDDGTLYRVEEGELFNPGDGQYVRQTNMQEHIDIIERSLTVTPHAINRFCDWGTLTPLVPFVEACGDCFSNANNNIQRTCVDRYAQKVFVRSRISDRRGRRWVTRIDDR